MLALSDDILKFDKLAQTLQDDTMSLDERFMGGGLKIQDLLQQNNFIMNQMRKMKEVFLNYCRLNQKVYNKILEHENIAGEHMKKIVSAQNSIDKKIRNVVDDFTISQERMIKQNKNKHLQIQEMMNKFRKQLTGKVNQQGFSERIKKLIEDYDQDPSSLEENHQQQYQQVVQIDQNGVQTIVNVPSMINPQSSIAKKNKRAGGGLTIQDINRLKNEITPLIDEVTQKLNKHSLNFQTISNQMQKNQNQLTKLSSQVTRVDNQRYQLLKQTNNRFQQTNNYAKNIVNELRSTINEEIWKTKLNQFNTNIIKPQNSKLLSNITEVQILMNEKFEMFNNKIISNIKTMDNLTKQMKNNKANIKKLEQKQSKIEQELQKQHQQVLEAVNIFKSERLKAQKSILASISDTIKQQRDQRVNELTKVKKDIENIVQITEQKVLKKVQIRFSKELKQIRSDIVLNNKKIKQNNISLYNINNDVSHIKDTVSKKANFSDLVGSLDKKVDKAEYKQIQQLINSPTGSAKIFQSRKSIPSGLKMQTMKMRTRKSTYLKGNSMDNKFQTNSGKILEFGFQMNQNDDQKSNPFKNLKSQMISKHKTQRPSTAKTIYLL